MVFSHPEVETGLPSTQLELMHSRHDLLSLTTSVDLLEVYRQPKLNVVWKKDLDHDLLLQHIGVCAKSSNEDPGRTSVPNLRVLYV